MRDKLADALREGRYSCVQISPGEGAAAETTLPAQEQGAAERVKRVSETIIQQTAPMVCAYLLDLAAYLPLGEYGTRTLTHIIRQIHQEDRPAIINTGWGGDHESAIDLAYAVFERYRADGVVVTPWGGIQVLNPFFTYPHKAVFITSITSSVGREKLQDRLALFPNTVLTPLHKIVAQDVGSLSSKHTDRNGILVGVAASAKICGTEDIRREAGEGITILLNESELIPDQTLKGVLRDTQNSRGGGVVLCTSRRVLRETFAGAAPYSECTAILQRLNQVAAEVLRAK